MITNPEYAAFGHGNPQAKTGGTGQIGGLFGDPNFINFLAGTGARMDPQGVGGALGGATQDWIQQKQMGKAMEKQGDLMERLLEALAGGKVKKAKIDPKGGISLEGADDMSLEKPVEQSGFQTPDAGALNDMMQQSIQRMEQLWKRLGR